VTTVDDDGEVVLTLYGLGIIANFVAKRDAA